MKPLEPGALGADVSVDRSHTLGGPHRAQLTRGACRWGCQVRGVQAARRAREVGAEKQVRALRAPRSPSPALGGVPCSPREGGSRAGDRGVWWPTPYPSPALTAVLRRPLAGMPPPRQAWGGGAGPGPRPGALFPGSSCAWELSGAGQRLSSPCERAQCYPCVAGGSAERERGVEGGGGDREAVAVSRPWAAGAVMLRDRPGPTRPSPPLPIGTMLGLCASVQPLTRTLGPTLGGLLYHSFGVPVFGHVQFVVNFLVLLVLWRQPMPPKMDKAW